jgi:hypothetical protein
MPVVAVKVTNRKGPVELPTFAVVDSGADCSAIPTKVAEELGVSIERDCSKKTGMSAAGDSPQYIYSPGFEAEVLGRRFELEAVFMDTPVMLLGQGDFFSQFRASFDWQAQTFTLEPY